MSPSRLRTSRSLLPWRPAAILGIAGTVEIVLLFVWQGNAYWSFSDGVYAESSRLFLHGLTPYRDFAAAQPPPVFLVGALMLAISDTPAALHVGLGVVDFGTAYLVAVAVWRLTEAAAPAVVAGIVAPLLPITLNSHAQLLPETLAAPLVLAAALTCARDYDSWTGGVLLALAVWCKFAFVLPALAVAVVAARRRRTLVAAALALIALIAASLLAFGSGLWRETVTAQLDVGDAAAHYVGGLLAQVAWSELPLLGGALLFGAAARVDAFRDRALVRTLGAAAVGGVMLAVSLFKRGSYLNVMAVADPVLLAIAVAGAAQAWARWRRTAAVVVVGSILLAGESLSLLAHPSDPWLAVRPFAASGLAWSAGPDQVTRAVAAARRCPAPDAYSGLPYIAFLAGRRMPGNQPDLFMLSNASTDARFAHRAAVDLPVCPPR